MVDEWLKLTTFDEILHLMEIGQIWIERSGRDGFFFAVNADNKSMIPINQNLAKSIVMDYHVSQQRWYEGWGSPKPTDVSRWVHTASVFA